ncbi:uncharacterized protein LOC105698962 [Orussus abietinus]|uniref:uncharacterized protein LOC105698962 n=1 Tax=Orussus abietinus TaxID=222816 RepID=UPI000625FD99|nr:uncharacterized protein LOC105698962 [Orussus abietinus]XP_023289380.1 uncharacterized protein LOC105698962 [Orussus abietinus]
MSRPILSRPRTRVYGCNYDKGESYYKPMVDHLDRKYSGRPLFSEPRNSLADEIAARRTDFGTRDLAGSRSGSYGRDLDLEIDPRPRTQPPTDPFLDDEETVFDSRGQRTRRKFADDFASEVASTTRRFKAKVAAIGFDEDLENNRRPRFEIDDKFLDSFGAKAKTALEEADSAFKRRSKFLGEDDGAEEKPSLSRWTKLVDEDLTGAAANRAKQTKARLNDLETEMEEMAERQAKRERRAAALRALVNENVAASEDLHQSISSSKKVSVRAERAEKHVTF